MTVQRRRVAEQMSRRGDQRNRRHDHARAIDDARRRGETAEATATTASASKAAARGKRDRQRHDGGSLQPHAAAAAVAGRVVGDELDAERVERRDKLHQRIDIAADHALAGFHALDGRQRQAGQFSKRALIDAEDCSGGAQLARSDHENSIRNDVFLIINYDCHMILDHATPNIESRRIGLA